MVICKMVGFRIRMRGGLFPGHGNWGHFTPAPIPAAIGVAGDSGDDDNDEDNDDDDNDNDNNDGDDNNGIEIIDLTEDDLCVICQEPISDSADSTFTECGHHYHTRCFCMLVSHSNRPLCPVCRKPALVYVL
jgi:hypothetical protein